MDKKRIFGFIIAGIGILGIIYSFEIVQSLIKIPLPPEITNNILLIIGLIFVAIGVLLAYKKKKSKSPNEVPIYQGQNVVGYRRQ